MSRYYEVIFYVIPNMGFTSNGKKKMLHETGNQASKTAAYTVEKGE